MKTSKHFVPIVLVLIAVLAVTVPFANKPINSDDIYIITFLRHIQSDPLDPYGFTYDGLARSANGLKYTDPPLLIYYAALIVKLFGENVMILHLSYIPIHILGAISLYFLSVRFTKNPLFATALAIATPTFVVSSHSIMQDLPAMSFSLLALALFIKGVDEEKKAYSFFGALIAGFAFLIKYNAALIIFLLFAYSFMKRNFTHLKYACISFAPVAVFFVHNIFYYGNIHIIHSLLPWLLQKGFIQESQPWIIIASALFVANLCYIGGATIFPAFLTLPFLRKRSNLFVLAFSFAVSILISIGLYNASAGFVSGRYSVFQLTLLAFFAGSALFILILICRSYLRSAFMIIFKKSGREKPAFFGSDQSFLLLWAACVFVFNFAVAGGSPRYNTLFLPPFIFLFTMALPNKTNSIIPKNALLWTIFASTLILSLCVAYADFIYAKSYSDFSENLPIAQKRIFFLGHEGFKYYMEQKGAIFYHTYTGYLEPGDIIIKSRIPSPGKIGKDVLSRIDLDNTINMQSDYAIRTLNPDAHAGWYMYGTGLLPFSFSKAPLESFEVYSVKEKVWKN